jgi:hypothetical protein
MDSIWQKLPLDLAQYICNKLPQVRGIPFDLKDDIVTQQWRLTRFAKNWSTCRCYPNPWVHPFIVIDEFIKRNRTASEHRAAMSQALIVVLTPGHISGTGYEVAARSMWTNLTEEEMRDEVFF